MRVREGTTLLNNSKTPGRQNNLRRSPAAPAAHCQHPAGIATASCPPAARSFTPQPDPNRNNHKDVNKVTTAGRSLPSLRVPAPRSGPLPSQAARARPGAPPRGRTGAPGAPVPAVPPHLQVPSAGRAAAAGLPVPADTGGRRRRRHVPIGPGGRCPAVRHLVEGRREEGRKGRLPWRRAPRPQVCYRGDGGGCLCQSVCQSLSLSVCLSAFGSVPSYHAQCPPCP